MNNHLFIEPYLHQMMPVLLSCILGKNFGNANAGANGNEAVSHWKLRQNASLVVGHICRKFSSSYQTLHLRTCKTLVPEMPLPSHYGALWCLGELGKETLETFLMPILKEYVASIDYVNRFDSER